MWHSVALIDSEYGLTHKLDMSFYESNSMTIKSEIEYKGISASHTYQKSVSYEHGDSTPDVVSNGDCLTRLGEYRHVYQEGRLYMTYYEPMINDYVTVYLGPFQREYIDKWYTLSYDNRNYWYQISETRNEYLGKWGASHSAWIKMSESTTHTGSLGFEVKKKDVFGAYAKITFTVTHTVEAVHKMIWVRPTSETYLKIYGGNLFDVNTYDYIEGGGGCPFIEVWDGETYVTDNNILPQSELYGTETDYVDRYKLGVHPVINDEGFKLRLTEFENEHSYIDRVQLLAISHRPNVNIAVDSNGRILTYRNPEDPVKAVLNDGTDVLELVGTEDEIGYDGTSGSVMYLAFKQKSFPHGAKLVMNADAITKFSIYIDVLTPEGWTEAGIVVPRIRWAHEIVVLDSYLDEAYTDDGLQIRLRWAATHKLDYVGLDCEKTVDFEIAELPLLGAWHNIEGDVLESLLDSDDIHAELLPGEEILLLFQGLNPDEERAYIIVVEGRYYSL